MKLSRMQLRYIIFEALNEQDTGEEEFTSHGDLIDDSLKNIESSNYLDEDWKTSDIMNSWICFPADNYADAGGVETLPPGYNYQGVSSWAWMKLEDNNKISIFDQNINKKTYRIKKVRASWDGEAIVAHDYNIEGMWRSSDDTPCIKLSGAFSKNGEPIVGGIAIKAAQAKGKNISNEDGKTIVDSSFTCLPEGDMSFTKQLSRVCRQLYKKGSSVMNLNASLPIG